MDFIIHRRSPSAIMNCFTGCLMRAMNARGSSLLNERTMLEAGGGYLFRAGSDEFGMPEYTFDVLNVGLMGCSKLGAVVQKQALDKNGSLDLLCEIAATRGGVVVWVNTAHLKYEAFYQRNLGYLHAILVLGC